MYLFILYLYRPYNKSLTKSNITNIPNKIADEKQVKYCIIIGVEMCLLYVTLRTNIKYVLWLMTWYIIKYLWYFYYLIYINIKL